ncbi:MAG: prepilin-type N-terminal cleavage/methylation domain-containing protein [Magnetococcales bacterium]|nr:prepilin-type N-terminal cleavage/methylation domain-containing protein [Magnetococcales bacterium]
MNHPIRGCRVHSRHTGFTLVELIMVVAILGILTAVAVPKFTDLSSEAEIAAANGIFSAAQAATSTNFAAVQAGRIGATPITDATSLLGAMDGTPTGWSGSGNALTHTGQSGMIYTIAVVQIENATQKANLSKNW